MSYFIYLCIVSTGKLFSLSSIYCQMSDFTLSFECEDYLRQWCIHDAGGLSPVRLRKNSPESNCLQFCLVPKRKAEQEPEISGTPLVVIIPCFRYRNPEVYNHITAMGRKAFLGILKKRFDIQLWADLHCIYSFGLKKEDMVYAWMESHGIEPTEKNYFAVDQRLQRIRQRTLNNIRVKKYRNSRKK